ncbi:MAG TPA: YbgC/FadM family acyl-CoA thioesterase [Albitalea sp.]|jgi:YbgC/YbaW family acyl-CoA thioester hydrolase|nr:YbgC/FadM family acyl-CoA thioesterase [Albitalea sp.]
MKRTEFRYLERLRVRWAEIDQQKIVFNSHYLMYVDTAITGYWRALALPYVPTLEALGGDLYVRKSTLEYHGSARLDDLIDVGIRSHRVGNSSLVFATAVFRNDELLISGEMVYVFADPATQGPKPVPQALRDVLQDYEAGQPMVDVRVGSWAELGRDAQAIRTAVFVDEQKIPAEMEWDEADAGCVHAVAVNRFGVPLATGRLLGHGPGIAKIGRMAVAQAMRGSRVGRSVLDALMQAARERGDREVVLHAQLSAAPFYARAGFSERGAVFDEAGIPHIEMAKAL